MVLIVVCCLMVGVFWSPVVVCSLMFAVCWLLCLSFVARCLMFLDCRFLFNDVCCWLVFIVIMHVFLFYFLRVAC